MPLHRPAGLPAALSLFSLVALASLGGCVGTSERSDAPFSLREDYASGTVSYTVQRGDALANIALEFTGDMSTWQSIAAHNGIDDPRRLAVGQVIQIPGNLIPGTVAAASEAEPAPAIDPTSAQPDRVVAEAPRAPVVVSAVQSNRAFELAPIDETTGFDAGRFVKVVGTYFPIALYAEPSSASRLVMRVAPGTVFPLDREIGDWLKLDTDAGPAFLRGSDGELVSQRERSAALSD